jgi:hypothetical protein
MAKEWREFEKLVARIEDTLSPAGAVVKSPDRITDKVTGQKREVDASIRYTVGTASVLITVECRKRKHKQDDTWIEQLILKKQKIGAALTIAVTTKDLTEPAKKTASLYGILYRQISEITQVDMLEWVKINEIQQVVYYPVIEGTINLKMHSPPGETEGRLHPSVIKMVKADPGKSKVFVRHSDGKAFSLEQILDVSILKGLDIFSGVPLDGKKVRKNVVLNFSKGVFHILSEQGPRDLGQLQFAVDVNVSVEKIPVSEKGFSYSGSSTSNVYGVETATELLGQPLRYSFFKKEKSNVLHVRISKEKRDQKK